MKRALYIAFFNPPHATAAAAAAADDEDDGDRTPYAACSTAAVSS